MRGGAAAWSEGIFLLGIIIIWRTSLSEGVGQRSFNKGHQQGQLYTPSVHAKTTVSKHVCSYTIQKDGSKEISGCRKALFCKNRGREGKAGKKRREEWLVERRDILERGKIVKSEEALVRLCSSTGKQERGRKQGVEPKEFCGDVGWNHLREDEGNCRKYFSCQKVYNGTWRIQKGMWPGYFFLEKVSGGRESWPGARWEWEVYHFMCRRGWSFDGVKCRKGGCKQDGLYRKDEGNYDDDKKEELGTKLNIFQDTTKVLEKKLEVTTQRGRRSTDLNRSTVAKKEETTTELPELVKPRLTTEFSLYNVRDFVPIFNENIKIQNNVNRNALSEYVEGESVIYEKYEGSGNEINMDEDFDNKISSGKKVFMDDIKSMRKSERDSNQRSKIPKTFRRLNNVKYGGTKTILLYRATPTHAQGTAFYY